MLNHSIAYYVVKWATKINDMKWWFLHRFVPRYKFHVHKFHRLSPGWHDVDYKMLHACFDFLVEFVELEDGLDMLKFQFSRLEKDGVFDPEIAKDEGIDLDYYEHAKGIYNEVKELYDWWKPLTNEQIEDMEFFSNENREICTEKLVRLVKVRRYLWT